MATLSQVAKPARKADQLERWSLACSGTGLGMLALIGMIAAWTFQQVSASDSWVDHTNNVIDTAQQLTMDVKDAESAARAYLLIPEDRFQGEFKNASMRIPDAYSSLKSLTADNPGQQHRLDELGPLLTQRVTDLTMVMRVRRDKGLDAALDLRRDDSRRIVAERVRQLNRDIQDDESSLLRERIASRRVRLGQGLAGTFGAGSFALIAFIVAPLLVRRAVAQRDSANREKQESDSMANSLFEAAPQAIIIADRSGSIVMANPTTEKIFGYTADELRQMKVEALIPETMRSEHVNHRGRFFAAPQTRPMGLGMDLKGRRKDASEFDAEISLSYIEATPGIFAVAFATDISKRRADEQAIRDQKEELRLLTGKLLTAQEDESRRIARNLHDDLSQTLAYISMDLGKLASKEGLEAASPHLRPLQARAAEASEMVRRISHQIHPGILDDLGLRAALEEFCNEFEDRTGIATRFTATNVPDYLPSDVSSCIYYIAGECLRNVSKHSRARSAQVDIECSETELRLQVKDNGIGSAADPSNSRGGIGIAAMRERAHLLGGVFAIQSSPGKGTEVAVEVPVSIG